MLHILVHLHLYYHDQVDYFLEKIGNINGVDWDLIVTFSERNEESEKKIKAVKPDARFIEVENFGYDIWPFIKVVKEVDLVTYDLVVKLHTKRSVERSRSNVVIMKGYEWRNALVDGILYSKEYFSGIIEKFLNHPEIGMISSFLTYTKRDCYHYEVKRELERLELSKQELYLCKGSMFIMRTEPLKFLKNEKINGDLFNEKPQSGSLFQTAHLYERLLCSLPVNAGFRHVPSYPHKTTLCCIKTIKALEPIGKFIFTCEREGVQRKLFIKVLGIRVYKEK